jgi:hypothetical protein
VGRCLAAVASGLSGQTYGNEDIQWVLDQAGSFVVEAVKRDRSVYRLYHQALADHLRRGRDPVPTQRRITEALVQTVPGLAATGNRDWRVAQPYILAHLPEHAATGCRINHLLVTMVHGYIALIRKCTLFVFAVLFCSVARGQDIHQQDYTLSLPTHPGRLHLEAPQAGDPKPKAGPKTP